MWQYLIWPFHLTIFTYYKNKQSTQQLILTIRSVCHDIFSCGAFNHPWIFTTSIPLVSIHVIVSWIKNWFCQAIFENISVFTPCKTNTRSTRISSQLYQFKLFGENVVTIKKYYYPVFSAIKKVNLVVFHHSCRVENILGLPKHILPTNRTAKGGFFNGSKQWIY